MKLSPQTRQSLITALFSSVFTLLLLLFLNYFLNHSWNPFSKGNQQPFMVTGSATITQKPDQSIISFSVTKTAPTLQEAQNMANTSMNTIVADIEKLGIEKSKIKTSNYSSYPNYDNNSGGVIMLRAMPAQKDTNIVSYTVSENVDITLSDVASANKVIDTVTKDGAENVSGPNLTFSDATQKELTQKVRLDAIKDAKAKAEDLAKAAGIRLGRIVNIQENAAMPFPMMRTMDLKVGSSEGSAPTQINPGENTLTSTVTLSYETW